MTIEHSCGAWAERVFGQAKLGDTRRTKRLVGVAAQAAAKPAGKVTAVFDDPADREGAFRLLENDAVAPEEIGRAVHHSTARASAKEALVFVPVDGSSLKLTDTAGEKGFGAVGAHAKGARGLCVMSAIAVATTGTPIGLCGQVYWARPQPPRHRRRKQKRQRPRPALDTETRHWLDVQGQVIAAFTQEAPRTRPWFQLDRGGDAWPVLCAAVAAEQLVTVRAAHDRRLFDPEDNRKGRPRRLKATLAAQPLLGTCSIKVPGKEGRQARTANMELRSAPVRLDLTASPTSLRIDTEVWAVLTREAGTTPAGEQPIEWLLLTTYPVTDVDAARLVVFGYSQRWRIEEFHKAWKSGACRSEETQLRAVDNVLRWAPILAAVAMRILALTYLQRTAPETPATEVFSDAEIKATLLLARQPLDAPRGKPITVSVIARHIARLGGYTGKSSGGPPGALVLARGLQQIRPVAQLFSDGVL